MTTPKEDIQALLNIIKDEPLINWPSHAVVLEETFKMMSDTFKWIPGVTQQWDQYDYYCIIRLGDHRIVLRKEDGSRASLFEWNKASTRCRTPEEVHNCIVKMARDPIFIGLVQVNRFGTNP